MNAAHQLPSLDGLRFDDARAHVVEAGELHLVGVRATGAQLQELLAAAPRDPQRPERARLERIEIVDCEVVDHCVLGGVVCGVLRIAGSAFLSELDVRDATVLNTTSVTGTRFARTRWAAHFQGGFNVGSTTFGTARFDETCFEVGARFHRTRFEGPTRLSSSFGGPLQLSECSFEDLMVAAHPARFGGNVLVLGTTFAHDASFAGVTFGGAVDLSEVTFARRVHLSDTRFRDQALFTDIEFAGAASFDRAVFHGHAAFDRSAFGHVSLARATFLKRAAFRDCRFAQEVAVADAVFAEDATFAGARFERARQLGPLLAAELDFGAAVFEQPIRIELGAHRLLLDRALFQQGGDLFLRWADVRLDETSFSGPSLIAQAPTLSELSDPPAVLGFERPEDADGWSCARHPHPTRAHWPRILSLRSAKVARLTLSRVDLRACLFAGAHGLDQLRLEQPWFARTPRGWHSGLRRVRWTRRQTIAEEHHWRDGHNHGRAWRDEATHGPLWCERSEVLDANQIAAIYRALRKGREDDKDEPGAADFYYGEMEMRRQQAWMSAARLTDESAPPTPRSTRLVLGAYWLVSGYGLRASHALLALAATILLLAVPLDLWGFRPDRAYGRTVLFAAESSISLLRAPTAKLSASGEVVQIALRLAGPLLFGLAVLALRSRVKR